MNKRKQFGYSLIELLTAVAIVGILASIIVQSYRDSVRKARRSDSQAVVLELKQLKERFYATIRTARAIQ